MIVQSVVSGLVATLFLDLWQRLLATTAGIPAANWGLVGRWFVEAGRGRIFHDSIAAAPPAENEVAIGWIGHYATGIVYGVVYVILIVVVLGGEPTLVNGLVFGAVSALVPWFFFMPAMGAGRLGRNTPDPRRACLLAFLSHCAFGLGLAAGAILAA